MNRRLRALKYILKGLVLIYERALELLDKEAHYLIKVDSDGLIEVLQKKQALAETIGVLEDKLKEFLESNGFENISEFLFFASRDNYVDDLRVLNGKLKSLLEKFELKSEVNRMIAKEHLEFFNGLLSFYATLLSGGKYDKNANPDYDTQLMSVRA